MTTALVAAGDGLALTYREALRRTRLPFEFGRPITIAIGGNCNASFLEPGLTVALRERGFLPSVVEIPMDNHVAWALEGGKADIVLLWISSFAATTGETTLPEFDTDGLRACTQSLIDRGSRVFIVTFEQLSGESDLWGPVGGWRKTTGAAIANALPPEVVCIDAQIIQMQFGRAGWFAPRYWASARCPCHPDAATAVGTWAGYAIAQSQKLRIKAVAVDLDNTLWGGVVGDDGVENLELDPFSEGRPFLAMQRFLQGLKSRGIPIAAVTKNEPAVVQAVFEGRTEMILTRDDFFEIYASWNAKHTAIVDFTEALNISLESVCFIDDSPHERAEIKAALPDLVVPELPDDPDERLLYLMNTGMFLTPVLGTDDRARAKRYVEEKARRAERSQAQNVETYLANLGMELHVHPLTAANLPRAVALIQKTNQFNLSNRRHQSPAILEFVKHDDCFAAAYRVIDRFGDSGIVSVVLARCEMDVLALDTWVLSCRAFGRGIEHAIYEHVTTWGHNKGCHKLRAPFVPNGRNALVSNLLTNLGARKISQEGEIAIYESDMLTGRLHYLRIIEAEAANQ